MIPGSLTRRSEAPCSRKVKRQVEVGLAVVNDGEQSKISFATYVRERLHGFGGADESRPVGLEARQFPPGPRAVRPRIGGQRATPRSRGRILLQLSRTSPTSRRRLPASGGGGVHDRCLTGHARQLFPNRHYPSREAYLEAMAEVMKREYDAIVQAGFLLQLDCPDLPCAAPGFPISHPGVPHGGGAIAA